MQKISPILDNAHCLFFGTNAQGKDSPAHQWIFPISMRLKLSVRRLIRVAYCICMLPVPESTTGCSCSCFIIWIMRTHEATSGPVRIAGQARKWVKIPSSWASSCRHGYVTESWTFIRVFSALMLAPMWRMWCCNVAMVA